MKRIKLISILLIFLLLAIGIFAGYRKLAAIREQISEANSVIGKAEKFDTLNSAISREKTRCQEFVSQREGEFGEFEYCKGFLRWADNLK